MSTFDGGILLPKLDGDGKYVVASNPATPGWSSWITSAGDLKGPPIVRGGGDLLQLSWDATEARGTKEMEIQFAEPIQMHDGGANYNPSQWGPEDQINWRMVINAAVTTPNTSGTGNCNKINIGNGAHIIVPAAGDGDFDVNLSIASPAPSSDSTGFWDSDYVTGTITPNVSQKGRFNLFDFTIQLAAVMRVHFHNMQGAFQLPAYGVAWIHPNWRLRAIVDKQSPGAGVITGWLRVYRASLQVSA